MLCTVPDTGRSPSPKPERCPHTASDSARHVFPLRAEACTPGVPPPRVHEKGSGWTGRLRCSRRPPTAPFPSADTASSGGIRRRRRAARLPRRPCEPAAFPRARPLCFYRAPRPGPRLVNVAVARSPRPLFCHMSVSSRSHLLHLKFTCVPKNAEIRHRLDRNTHCMFPEQQTAG